MVKRQPLEKPREIYTERLPGVWRWWPIVFWSTCVKCKMEFRREWMWASVGGGYMGGSHTVFCCMNCATTPLFAKRTFKGE